MKALQQSKEELKTHLHFLVSLKIKQYKLVTDRLEYKIQEVIYYSAIFR